MKAVPELERKLIIEAMREKYGYDFSQYAMSSFDRRLNALLLRASMKSYAELLQKVLESEQFFSSILPHLTIGTTELFREPDFFKSLALNVFPHLLTYPSINIWVAGCSTGQEVYSLAILLAEAGLYERSVIFATDVNPQALRAAREGIYAAETVREQTKAYIDAGGSDSLSKYYSADYGLVRIASSLRDNIVFSEHNLTSDHIFTEAHLILCRNVLIYFNRDLQNRALRLFTDSLHHNCYLGLGSKENLRFSKVDGEYSVIDNKNRIYRKQRVKA